MSQWQEIERLYLAALELSGPERIALLERETAHDPELRSSVEGMLRHHVETGVHIQRAVGDAAHAVFHPAEPEPIHIDKFTIVRELGRGGMGTVYLAERTDAEFFQRVAVKVVTQGFGTGHIVERFRHERRILASLDHPNIARLLDGGTTPQGAPYLVMEYVDGSLLADYCRERGLSVRERLGLFEQVCSAVQHAHQKLVVHRDIKPANILVAAGGVPKLLDFGIAKLLEPEESGDHVLSRALTHTGMRPFTPEYASPEQVRGDPVNVSTDIYSLGAVLYELLTSKRPHQFRNYSQAEFELAICHTEARPPSEVVEDKRLRRELAGDLDKIIGLALRKEPERRYVSVEQFAGDIRRYLDGHPVLARPETLAYRALKFARRNRIAVAAAAMVLLTLVAGIASTTLQARRADLQAARAERRFQQVRKLANTFVFDVYDGMADIPGTAKLRAHVVTTALEYLDSLAGEAGDDSALLLELAAAYRRIADVQGNPALSGLGQTKAAMTSYDKAAAILDQLAATGKPDPKVLADLAILRRTIGFVHTDEGDPARGIVEQRKSIAAWERRNPVREQDLEADTGIAQAWGNMSKALLMQGEAASAVQYQEAGLKLLRSWLPRKTAPTTRGTISLFLYDLGNARLDTGDLAGALAAFEESASIRKEILKTDPKNFGWRRRLFSLHYLMARVHGNPFEVNLGNPDIARRYAAEAFRESEAMAEEDRGSARSLRDRYLGQWIMGSVLLPADARRAIPYLESALKLAPGQEHLEALAQEALASALLKAGDRRRAIDLLGRASVTIERISQASPQVLEFRSDLIRVWNSLADALPPAPEAHEYYRKAFVAAESAPANERNVRELQSRAECALRWIRWNASAPEAERRHQLERALRLWSKLRSHAPNDPAVQANLDEIRRALGQAE